MKDRRGPAALAVAFLLGLSVGCDTTQPLSVGTQTLQLSFRARATAVFWDVYDFQEDTDLDGTPDTLLGVICNPVSQADPPAGQPALETEAPATFSLQITRIPAGTSRREVLLTPAVENPFSNLTPYDTETVLEAPALPPGPPFYFLNPRRLPETNRTVIEECPPFLEVGDPVVGGGPAPFELEVEKGDTIIVEARKAIATPFDFETNPILLGFMMIDGRRVTLSGTTVSTDAPGDGITFSFTVR